MKIHEAPYVFIINGVPEHHVWLTLPVCLGHFDDSNDMSYLTELVERGYTIGMDHISWGTPGQPRFLSWQQRAESIKKLIDAGFVDKIFMSHDWYFGISIAAKRWTPWIK